MTEVPASEVERIEMSPWWCLTISLHSVSPSPRWVCCRSRRPLVKNGSKTRGSTSGGIPRPLSDTTKRTECLLALTSICTFFSSQDSCEKAMLLETRLASTTISLSVSSIRSICSCGRV